jgi:hypothetical protein
MSPLATLCGGCSVVSGEAWPFGEGSFCFSIRKVR